MLFFLLFLLWYYYYWYLSWVDLGRYVHMVGGIHIRVSGIVIYKINKLATGKYFSCVAYKQVIIKVNFRENFMKRIQLDKDLSACDTV